MKNVNSDLSKKRTIRETCEFGKRLTKETYVHVPGHVSFCKHVLWGHLSCGKRPTQETNLREKRPAKEIYMCE